MFNITNTLQRIFLIGIGVALWPATAETTICGVIQKSTEWNKSKSPYIVTNDLYIPPGVRLTVEEGTLIQFTLPGQCTDSIKQLDWSDSQYVSVKVDGALFILGTESSPVEMEPVDFTPGTVGWDGIRVEGKNNNVVEIQWTLFRGANRAISATHSNFYVHHNIFEENVLGIYLGYKGNLGVFHNVFTGNHSAGIYVDKAIPNILNNVFVENHNYGIWSDNRESVFIRHNAFWNNREEDCFRCPFWVLENKNSTDREGNLQADPVFYGTPSYQKHKNKDLNTDTPLNQVKDPELARVEKKLRTMQVKKVNNSQKISPKKHKTYVLSEYSPLIDAGTLGPEFRDKDGTTADIGIYGGPQGRIQKVPY